MGPEVATETTIEVATETTTEEKAEEEVTQRRELKNDYNTVFNYIVLAN